MNAGRFIIARLSGSLAQVFEPVCRSSRSRLFPLVTLAMLIVRALVTSPAPSLSAQALAQAPTARLFDVTISLYNSPTSDADRAPYERIIEYFADGVFESSNGAHKIRRVSIYAGGDFADRADVVWVADCHPSARVSGRATQGAHINMCDTFSSVDFLQNDRGWQGGGYTLAHEWGHYFYSVYDEYRGDPSYDTRFSFPHSADDPVPNAIMNSQWNARGGHFAWLNFSTAQNNTRNTAQHRMYDASCWETLARPPGDDPRDGQRRALPQRIHYPELAAVAPGENQAPAIDLPGTARSDLEIVWVSGDVTYQIVLDHSNSMDSDSKMTNAKIAAKLLVDLAEVNQATIGVIMFDHTVRVVQPLTAIDTQATRDAIKARIDTIEPDGWTAIGDAAKKALDDLLAYGAENTSRVVYLLTDGLNNRGADPRSIIPEYQASQIPLFTFGYGPGADASLLQQMAQETGGKYYFSPTTLTELTQVFQDANQLTAPSVGLTTEQTTVRATAPFSFPIHVDSTLDRLDVVVTHIGPPSAVDLTLLDPSGNRSNPPACTVSGAETVCHFRIDVPSPGGWTLQATATTSDVPLTYRASGGSGDVITYAASVTALTGDVVQYPEPIVLLAVLGRELPISGAAVNATIQRPDGTVTSFPMVDNGVAPDAEANDGLYSAILGYTESGTHSITVQFDNRAGSAQLTYLGLQPSVGENGVAVPVPASVPIRENFERFARIQVNPVNVRADDHGNTPLDATTLPTDNTDIPGRIDYPNDLDVFAVHASGSGELVLRVSNLALGMDPKLRILASDTTTVLAEADVSTSGTDKGYLAVSLTVAAGEMVFAEVSHRSAGSQGTYEISAGSPVAGDLTRKLGDGNGDGLCTEIDALMALQMAVNTLSEDLNLDVDQDGQVSERDALTILTWAVRDGQCG